jgi:hypothetical protein
MYSLKSILFLSLLVIFSSVYSAKLKSELGVNSRTFLKEIVTKAAAGAFCFLNSNGTVYDLRPMKDSKADYTIPNGNSSQVDFNVCRNTINQCGNKTSMVLWTNKQNTKDCLALAGGEMVVSQWAIMCKN